MPTIKNIEEAKCVFDSLALLEIELAKQNATHEACIAALKALHTTLVTPVLAERDFIASDLRAYIQSHPEQFQKPRSVVTDFGRFGLHDVNCIEISDEAAIMKHAKDKCLDDLVKTTKTVVKAAISTRLRAGETIPGAHLAKGEEAFYTVAKNLLEQPPPEV